MFKNHGEKTLRALLDPKGRLPHVRLAPGNREEYTSISIFGIHHVWRPIGTLVLSRRFAPGGRPAAQIEEVRLHGLAADRAFHKSAVISALVISAEEGRALVSDDAGSTAGEVALWQEWSEAGVADITEAFVRRPELYSGQPIFDGSAIARPLLHR